jgi:Tol biopolymer transport system component
MNTLFVQQFAFSMLRLATTAVAAGAISSPMSWSPDSQWLSYTTVAPTSGAAALGPGWIFDTSRVRSESRAVVAPTDFPDSAVTPVYRIWASEQDGRTSVLIEESHWPLSTASWSPHGRSLAFVRFVPLSIDQEATKRGRIEAVVQRGLEAKQIVWTSDEMELDAETRALFPHLVCTWSPDGLFLGIPRPGREPALVIVRTDTKRRVHFVDRAVWPAWSPDGTRLAFIRVENEYKTLELIERRGQSFSAARRLIATGPVTAVPAWSTDGRSILAVVERATSRLPELELCRCAIDPEATMLTRQISLAGEPARRNATVRGIAIDFDREAQRCFFAVDIAGRESDLVWSVPRDHETHKRFNPFDPSERIGSLAVAPDGRTLAIRFGPPDALSQPMLYDPETEQTGLVLADAGSRRQWLAILTTTARGLLLAGLPPAEVEGHTAWRPTLLPLPGELAAQDSLPFRLRRIARLASSLFDGHAVATHGDEAHETNSAEIEARLFFDYLQGDFQSAASLLEALDSQVCATDQRLSLLSLRAQILWSAGKQSEARSVVEYLLSTVGTDTRRIEDTPLGRVITSEVSPLQAWARFLKARAAQESVVPAEPIPVRAGGSAEPKPLDPFDALDFRRAEPGGEPFPFGPAVRGLVEEVPPGQNGRGAAPEGPGRPRR